MFYIKEDVSYVRMPDVEVIFQNVAECAFVEMYGKQFGKKSTIIEEIYKPLDCNIAEFNECFDKCLSTVDRVGKLCYV